MDDTETPPDWSSAPGAASPVRLVRRGAVIEIDVIDTGDGAVRALAAAVGDLLKLARDVDLYAIVLKVAPGPMDPAAAATAIPADVIEAVWRFECFPKPIVSDLPETISTPMLALAAAGTHRVLASASGLVLADAGRGRLPPGNVLRTVAAGGAALGGWLAGATALPAAAALRLGLLTHVPAHWSVAALVEGLSHAEPVDELLDGLPARDPRPGDAWPAGGDDARDRSEGAALGLVPRLLPFLAGLDVRQALIATHRIDLARAGGHRDLERLLVPDAPGDLVLPARAELQSLRRTA